MVSKARLKMWISAVLAGLSVMGVYLPASGLQWFSKYGDLTYDESKWDVTPAEPNSDQVLASIRHKQVSDLQGFVSLEKKRLKAGGRSKLKVSCESLRAAYKKNQAQVQYAPSSRVAPEHCDLGYQEAGRSLEQRFLIIQSQGKNSRPAVLVLTLAYPTTKAHLLVEDVRRMKDAFLKMTPAKNRK